MTETTTPTTVYIFFPFVDEDIDWKLVSIGKHFVTETIELAHGVAEVTHETHETSEGVVGTVSVDSPFDVDKVVEALTSSPRVEDGNVFVSFEDSFDKAEDNKL